MVIQQCQFAHLDELTEALNSDAFSDRDRQKLTVLAEASNRAIDFEWTPQQEAIVLLTRTLDREYALFKARRRQAADEGC